MKFNELRVDKIIFCNTNFMHSLCIITDKEKELAKGFWIYTHRQGNTTKKVEYQFNILIPKDKFESKAYIWKDHKNATDKDLKIILRFLFTYKVVKKK